jgi:hypothetical protein
VDYRRFLQPSAEVSAPVVGPYAWLPDRRVRVEGDGGDGWWKVRARGRVAARVGAAPADEVAELLAPLPRLRGHALMTAGGGLGLVDGNGACHLVDLAPAGEEPPVLAPLSARRWPTGDLVLWAELEFEGELEETARRALEERAGLAGVKGVSAALRAAFAYAAALAASRALAIAVQPGEVKRWLGEIADQGQPRAEVALRALAEERARWAPRARAMVPRARPVPRARGADLETQVEESLRGAGARLGGVRRLGGGMVEVRWRFEGHRFVSVVAEEGLRVVDSGVCLAGEDRLLTLDSLPGVIREAIEEGALVITHHDGWR